MKHPYGLDHPTWDAPGCFFYDTAAEARASAAKTYREGSGHVVVGPIPDPCDHEAQIRDLLEEREELLTEIRRLQRGNHPAGRALPRVPSARQWDELVSERLGCDVVALREALTERDAGHKGGAS